MTKPKHPTAQPDDCYCYTAWVRYESKLPLQQLLEHPICFLDTETTGLGYSDRIVEISICRVEGQQEQWLTSLIDPVWVKLSDKASEISGITSADLEGAPMLDELAPRIAELVSGAYIVAHNAAFDRRMLEAGWRDLPETAPKLSPMGWVCSQQLTKEHLPGLKTYSLQGLVTALALPSHTAHRAEGDVRTLMALWAHITRGYRRT